MLEGLKTGNSVLKEIHKETSIEAVERLMDDTADAIAYQNVSIHRQTITMCMFLYNFYRRWMSS